MVTVSFVVLRESHTFCIVSFTLKGLSVYKNPRQDLKTAKNAIKRLKSEIRTESGSDSCSHLPLETLQK